ncbi:prolyl oligopeptidase family serine peptidase [Roseimaritima sediminicola]|uniref:prolyl oligopeptidase family serine peptidase n=1 Tax=Roseimaritima sediminicola TaxID=2662066 RepID=UPI00129824DF|nr:prolyl oligopeptidase family serine peptidase [Roseimaritima sediminicola]
MKTFDYPESLRQDVTDDYHGTDVADPYRWLEDTESEATARWVEAQNRLTNSYLEQLPQRAGLEQRLEQLWNYERFGMPVHRGDTFFYTHNDGLQDQSVLYKADSLDADRQVLLNPNRLSEDGTVALAAWRPTDDGRLVAYATADGGSDWRTYRVRDVASGEDLPDVIEWVKFSGVAWNEDASGFFYGRYEAPAEGEELTGTNYNQTLYFHAIGTSQDEDVMVYRRPDHKEWGFQPEVSEDGRWLVINNWKGSEPQNQIFLKDLSREEAAVEPLIEGFDAEYSFIASDGTTLYFLTDHEAPRRRVIAIDAQQPQREHWREVIPEQEHVLESVNLLGKRFFTVGLDGAVGVAQIHALDGTLIKPVPLPGLGTVGGFGGRRDAKQTFFTFTNYVTPPSIYRFDLQDDSIELWRKPEVDFPSDQYETTQGFATSADGTRVPVLITARKGLRRDGTNKTLLYAYGGFNISITPQFSPAVAGWLDAGGVYVVATLRGGGEFGRQWHEAGMQEKKQNVFDDFIAAAEYLIAEKVTRSESLGIYGRSNGGLLVGAVMTQRPDLFGACLPAVGVMDMLRFHKFTIGWAWVTEFGSSDDPEQFQTLLKYSPLHNLRPGTCYPATLVTTADRDDRVVPGHSFKFAAALQAAQSCQQPALIRIETRAGHGAGTPVSKFIEQYADMWAFLLANLR